MRTITLHISDDVFTRVRSGLTIKALACTGPSVADALVAALWKKLEAGETEWTPVPKGEIG